MFKKLLRNIRKEKGLTVRELARKSKVSAGYISMLENNLLTNDPSVETIKKLEDALGVDKGVLMSTSTTANTIAIERINSDPQKAIKFRILVDKIDKDDHLLDKLTKFLLK